MIPRDGADDSALNAPAIRYIPLAHVPFGTALAVAVAPEASRLRFRSGHHRRTYSARKGSGGRLGGAAAPASSAR